MAQGVKLLVRGDYACWTRPEMKAERVSYDVMTPSGARGILEAIYWKPQIRWVVDKIRVFSPIRFTNIRRNEVASKVPVGTVKSVMKGAGQVLTLYADEDRQQRPRYYSRMSATALRLTSTFSTSTRPAEA
jgi:CRISPR-associated protein Cas5d